jgi:hypothetical protein
VKYFVDRCLSFCLCPCPFGNYNICPVSIYDSDDILWYLHALLIEEHEDTKGCHQNRKSRFVIPVITPVIAHARQAEHILGDFLHN